MSEDAGEDYSVLNDEPGPSAAPSVETFTSGPWFQSHRRGSDGMYRTQVYDRSGETIATLAWHAIQHADGSLSTDRAANARAIAALPDLYEAAKEAAIFLYALSPDAIGFEHVLSLLNAACRKAVPQPERASAGTAPNTDESKSLPSPPGDTPAGGGR